MVLKTVLLTSVGTHKCLTLDTRAELEDDASDRLILVVTLPANPIEFNRLVAGQLL